MAGIAFGEHAVAEHATQKWLGHLDRANEAPRSNSWHPGQSVSLCFSLFFTYVMKRRYAVSILH